MNAPAVPLALEDIASPDAIARGGDPAHVAALRATLAALTPETVIEEEDYNGGAPRVLTMGDLAREHQASVEDGEDAMSDEAAWGYAVSDLVFANFSVRA